MRPMDTTGPPTRRNRAKVSGACYAPLARDLQPGTRTRWPSEYQRTVLARLELEPTGPHGLARILRREVEEAHAQGGPKRRTPSGNTIKRWAEEAGLEQDSAAAHLLRAVRAGGPVEAGAFDAALRLLGWGDHVAAQELGVAQPGMIEGWRTGELPIPTLAAAHIRTLIRVLAGDPPRLGGEGGGVGENQTGTHGGGGVPSPHVSAKNLRRS